MKSPRVLWLSPWLRPLVRVQAEELLRRGVDVLVVTTDAHPEADVRREYELVLDTSLRTAATWPAVLAAWRRIHAYRPDVVVAEMVRDPRWIALAGRSPRVQLVHDDRPHDPAEERPTYEHAIFDGWGARSTATVTFSDYVATAVASRRDVAGTPVHVLPLCSDLDQSLVPPFVEADDRRDFVMVGRLYPYKNVDVVLEAWQRHVDGSHWRGDDLVFIGDGPAMSRKLPKHTRWCPGGYRYSDVVATLAAAKGSVVHYRQASQSGVQVLSMQLGVMPMVSISGGLPEYQPPALPPLDIDDVSGLAAAFDVLADPGTAAACGAAAARHYADHCAVDRFADRFVRVLTDVLAARDSLVASAFE